MKKVQKILANTFKTSMFYLITCVFFSLLHIISPLINIYHGGFSQNNIILSDYSLKGNHRIYTLEGGNGYNSPLQSTLVKANKLRFFCVIPCGSSKKL